MDIQENIFVRVNFIFVAILLSRFDNPFIFLLYGKFKGSKVGHPINLIVL